MKICLLTDSFPFKETPFGGIGRYTSLVAEGLSRKGNEVHVILPQPPGISERYAKVGEVNLHFVVEPKFFSKILNFIYPGLSGVIFFTLEFIWRHFAYRFDVVEVPNYEGKGAIIALMRIVPTIARLHTASGEGDFLLHGRLSKSEKKTFFLEKLVVTFSTQLVTHSEFHKSKILSYYGISNRNVTVIPHGVAALEIDCACSVEQAKFILTVGVLDQRKGTLFLLEALPRILSDFPELSFIIVGRDSLKAPNGISFKEHFQRICPVHLLNRVSFKEYVNDKDLDLLYRNCFFYLSPSLYESFGLTFIEAMRYGKPCIGVKGSAVEEVVVNGKTGLLVDPKNSASIYQAVSKLCRDNLLYKKLALESLAFFKKRFTSEIMINKIIDLYLNVAFDRS